MKTEITGHFTLGVTKYQHPFRIRKIIKEKVTLLALTLEAY